MGDPNQRKSMIDFTPRRPEQVTLTVGKERLVWVIDAKSLEKSTHFSDLLKTSDTYKLELPDDHPLLLRVYLHFLVTDELPDLLTVGDESRFTTLARLCVYAANRRDKNFATAVIDETRRLVVAVKVNPCAEGVQVIYDCTTTPSPVREFLIDLFYHHGWPYWVTWVKDDIKNYPAEFLQDMLLKRITENEAKEVHNGPQASGGVNTGSDPASDLTITDDVVAAMQLSEAQIRVLLNTNDTFKAIIGKNAKNVIDKQLNPLKEQIAAKDGEIKKLTAEFEAAKSHLDSTNAQFEDAKANFEVRRNAFAMQAKEKDKGRKAEIADLNQKLEAAEQAKEAAVKQANNQANMKQKVLSNQKDMAQAKWNAIAQLAAQTPEMPVQGAFDIASKTRLTRAPAPVNGAADTASKPASRAPTKLPAPGGGTGQPSYGPRNMSAQWQDRFDGLFNRAVNDHPDAKKRKRSNQYT